MVLHWKPLPGAFDSHANIAFLFRTYCLSNAAQYWFPNEAISWYHVDESLESISYTNHHNKMGLEPNATVYEKYMISFYWVSATITANG